MESPPPHVLLRSKVLLLGEPCVGKSALAAVLQNQKFPKNYLMTLGVDFSLKSLFVPPYSSTVELYLFDTSGQDLFADAVLEYWDGASAVVLVYDVTRPETLERLDSWLVRAREAAPSLLGGVIVANKSDLADRAVVPREQGEALAQAHGFGFFACSAASGALEAEAPFAHVAHAVAAAYERHASSEL